VWADPPERGIPSKFEPSFADFETVLLNVYDVMLLSVSVVPRVETKLFSEWVSIHIVSFRGREGPTSGLGTEASGKL
jgi:hypothetical protein